MPTISQLPVLSSIDPADEIPLNHGGVTQSISVGHIAVWALRNPQSLAPTGTLVLAE